MLVILANRWDDAAASLAQRWLAAEARVLTPRDLSRPGWRQRLGRPADSTLVIDRDIIPQAQLTGVLTRLPCVFEQELEHIQPQDRTYVAAEMNAFLTFWLSSLTCPVLNRPTPGCLNGPAWRASKWAHLAAQAGIPLASVSQGSPPNPESTTSITVVGGVCPVEADPELQRQACTIAAFAAVDLVTVHFAGVGFLEVNLLPDLSDPAILAAVQTLFASEAAARPVQ